MKMEGRGYTDYYRNTSEELFIKTMMESSMGMQAPSPTMEMLGFKNLSQSFRADSEELFKNWLTTSTENNGGIANRTRQASRRISAEFSNLSNQQQSGVLQKKRTEELSLQQGTLMAGESSSEPNQHLAKNPVDKGLQATNLFLAKAWLNSSQPMTRSRSSELRRRYAAMQNTQTSIGIEAMNNMNSSTHASHFDQEYSDLNGFNNVPMSDVSNHMTTFMSPTNSSSSTFNIPQERTANNISSVVNMLKGTLERKKLFNNMDMEAVEDSFYGSEEALGLNQGHGNNPIYDVQSTFQDLSRVQFNETGAMQTTEGSYGYAAAATSKHIQMSTMSREPSQSESSAAATAISTGFDTCDGPSISGQAHSVSESSRKRMANGRTSENGPRPSKDVGEHMYDNVKDRKKGGLARYGSLTSVTSVEQGDPTKKRRVERSRKMAEAKERNMTPAVSSDMQSLLKRCENLEKEVRSLKLNLSFMNRKDSEQTKQIEEFQKQNEDLGKEKERLLGEIERIVGRM